MAGLSLSQLKKRRNLEILRSKILIGVKFSLWDQKKEQHSHHGTDSVEIEPSQKLLDALKIASLDIDNAEVHLQDYMRGKGLYLPTTSGLEVPTGHIYKSKDFGSIHSEDTYSRENREFNNFRKSLRKQTVMGLLPIEIVLTSQDKNIFSLLGVADIVLPENPKGNPAKADFVFTGKDNKTVSKISHKYGSKPTHFRQWSGIKHFVNHPEVIEFGERIKREISGSMVYPDGQVFSMPIVDPVLKRQAMFGFGDMQVDFVIQGKMSLEYLETENLSILRAPLILHNSDTNIPSDYEPVLLSMKSNDRAAFGIKGCRAVIYPCAGRKIHKQL